MDYTERRSRLAFFDNRKTHSAPNCDFEYQVHCRRIKIHDLCETPSTDDNNSQTTRDSKCLACPIESIQIPTKLSKSQSLQSLKVGSQSIDFVQLLNLIYVEDYTFQALQGFCYQVCLLRDLNSFHQILYTSIKDHLSQIRSNIHHSLNEVADNRMTQKHNIEEPLVQKNIYKSFGNHAPKYCQIISLLMKQYEMVDKKSVEIQKIVNFFMHIQTLLIQKDHQIQQVNCAELHRKLFVEMVLKDESIKTLLDNLTYINTESDFYKSSFRSAFTKLDKINSLRKLTTKPLVSNQTSDKQQPARIIKSMSDQKSIKEETQPKPHQFVILQMQDEQQQNKCSQQIITKTSNHTVSTQNTSSKKKKKSKKNKGHVETPNNLHKDDVKELERKMDLEFEMTKKNEKLKVEFAQDWINKLKHKLMQTIKSLH